MKTLINKLKNIKKSQLTEAIPYIVAGSLLLLGCNNKETQKISKHDAKDYVEFYDRDGKVYTDLGKDGVLDVVYNNKSSPVLDAVEIVDNLDSGESYFKPVLRTSDKAIALQIKFNEVKIRYNKQEERQ